MVEAAVHGGHAPAGGRLIDHVVVNEGGRVDHFGDLGQAPMARSELPPGGEGPRDQ